MKRKFLIFLLAVTLVLAAAVPGAYAAPMMDPAKLAGMTLTLSMPQNLDADLTGISTLTVNLYKIAESDEFGSYTNADDFPGLNLEIFDKETAASEWKTNIDAAVAIVKPEGDSVALGVQPAMTKIMTVTNGTVQPLTISFADNTPGIYLVMVEDAEGDYQKLTFLPMMIAMPENRYRTVQVPMGTEPAETAAQAGNTPTASELTDDWNYKVSAVLKPETERQKGQLTIVKTLDKFATITGTVSFVFEIEGTDPKNEGAVVYSNVAALSFSSHGNKSVTLEVPLGLDYTVTEVYSGGSYQIKWDGYGANDGIVELAADQFADKNATASFENDYDNQLIPGNGVVNEFSKDEEAGWQWDSADRSGESSSAIGGSAFAG